MTIDRAINLLASITLIEMMISIGLNVTVADVMTSAEQVEVIAYADVAGARVGHVLETLRRAGRQHALVVDYDEIASGRPLVPPTRRSMVRGIFSISQIARQLGVAVPAAGEVARTFSEIESAIK